MLQVITALFIVILTRLVAQENSISIEPINLDKYWQDTVKMYQDPRILNAFGLSSSPPSSYFQKQKDRIQTEQNSGTAITTYQIILVNGVFIGCIMLTPFTEANSAEISYIIHPDYQQKGYGKIAVNKLCTEILPRINRPVNLCALVNLRNIPSQKILSFCGFRIKDVPNLLDNKDIEYELQIN